MNVRSRSRTRLVGGQSCLQASALVVAAPLERTDGLGLVHMAGSASIVEAWMEIRRGLTDSQILWCYLM